MARVQLVRTADGFKPDSEHDEEELRAVHIGDVVFADVKKARNPAFHRKAFAMMHAAFDAQDSFHDFEIFREWLQIAAGIVDPIMGPDRTYYKVRSLSWAQMEEIEFDKTYNKLLTAAVEKLGMDWLLTQFG